MGGEGGVATSKLRKAARKVVVAAAYACGSFSRNKAVGGLYTSSTTQTISDPSAVTPAKAKKSTGEAVAEESESSTNNVPTSKNLCAICLDPLSYNRYSSGSNPGQAIFTTQCSHAFHFACISSNIVRHGSVTCPICRAHWTQLPCSLNPSYPSLSSCNQNDPIRAYSDSDDPIEPNIHLPNRPRLYLSPVPIPPNFHSSIQMNSSRTSCAYHPPLHRLTSLLQSPNRQMPNIIICTSSNRAFLSVKLAHQQATDLVLVASPNGPHLRLLKQSMALVVFSLRPIDRLAIVTYTSAAARAFPIRRMTSYGKWTALQIIDRLFYMGRADPFEGLKRGIKILEDRVHKNLQSCILHLSDSPTRSYHAVNMEVPIPIHRFHVGLGFGTSNGFVMHEFEQFLLRMLGGVIRDIQLKIGEEVNCRIIRIGELKVGEERRISLDLGEYGDDVHVGYSYVDECTRTGETVVSVGDKSNATGRDVSIGGRNSSVESWDYHDPYMARRWAKHLHGYRL
ncbi:probable E3 ubiquitin-protein ligase EDA40 [Corylus avellana]|uniref:probable E3 ubiquitin-protein ligase EDA40 n=1 Tax=Corylus avellana TaxID=13451 RepID=UPI001E20665F|nr:probable E3 ubiquitin-protein ligase EDA40 [Corylus avellana]